MNNELRKQIYSNLNLKETDELLSIWQSNNRTLWSDETFEVIKEILQERNVEIPEQGRLIDETNKEEVLKDEGLEEWEEKLLDDENQPELYDTLDVLDLIDNINKVAIGAIVAYILLGLLNLSPVRNLIEGVPLSFSGILQSLPNEIITVLNIALQIVITYFPLKALAHILRILMEMEFRSRKGI
ncbi:MAG TPA: hypothetical protein VJ821_06865 [Anaerolineales bacterium]|nr:hypothetical protein [Anaerolineales bacterium]